LNNNIKTKLKDFSQRIDKEVFFLPKYEEFVEEVKESFPNGFLETKNWSKEEQDLFKDLFFKLFQRKFLVYNTYISFWNESKLRPAEKELEYLERFQNTFSDFLALFDDFESEFPLFMLSKQKQKTIQHKQILDKLLQQEKNCEAEIQNIYQKISNSAISLSEAKNIWQEIGQIPDKYPNFRPSKKIEKIFEGILEQFADRLGDFRINWLEKKTIKPTSEELDILEFFADKFYDIVSEEISDEAEKKQMRADFDQMKNTIQQERKKRGLSPTKSTSDSISNAPMTNKKAQAVQKLNQQISELQIKVQRLEKDKQQNSDSGLEQKIKDLQIQIKVLQNELEKVQKISNSSGISKSLFGGKSSSEENKQSSLSTKNEFPWKIVLPLVGIIIVLIGVIIFAFWWKKTKEE